MSETKEKLLAVSRNLMMAKGYNATTVEEICKEAGVTKGAFFYHFKTKEDLGMSVLNDYWQTRQHQFAASDWMHSDKPLQQIQEFLRLVADVFMHDPDGISCLAGSFTQELATTHPAFQEKCAALFTEWAEQIRPVLGASSGDADLLADHIIAVIEGALILAQARQNPQVIEEQLSLLARSLEVFFAE
jgi:TetR/AcrR family transcriptional repressor of nem operon